MLRPRPNRSQAPSKRLKVQSLDIMSFDAQDKICTKRTYRKVPSK